MPEPHSTTAYYLTFFNLPRPATAATTTTTTTAYCVTPQISETAHRTSSRTAARAGDRR